MSEELNEEIEQELYYDEDCFIFPPLTIDRDNVNSIEYDPVRFQAGIEDVSFLCGQITALVNVGVAMPDVIAYLLSKASFDNNVDLAKINKETSVAVAKENFIQSDKNSL